MIITLLPPTAVSDVVPRFPRALSPVTPDNVGVSSVPVTIFCTGAGNLVVRCAAAPTTPVTVPNWPAGVVLPVEVVGVDTASTATGIFAVY